MFKSLIITTFLINLVFSINLKNNYGYTYNPSHQFVYPEIYTNRSYQNSKLNFVEPEIDISSVSFARLLNSAKSEEEYYRLLGIEVEPEPTIVSRFSERSNEIVPQIAGCMPELQVVPVTKEPDQTLVYIPPCIRIKRCGGCCNHKLLSCQPTNIEMQNFLIRVKKVGKPGIEKLIVPIEEHTSCNCDCTTKEEDCTVLHTYSKNECMCKCKNKDEEQKCSLQSQTKYWNGTLCQCLCRKVEHCSTGTYYDQNSCSCKTISISKLWYDDRRTGYRFQQNDKKPKETQPVIVPLDPYDARRRPKEDPEY